MADETASYLVMPETPFERRELSFASLSSARYFARIWAHKSPVAILVVDQKSGEPIERYWRRRDAA